MRSHKYRVLRLGERWPAPGKSHPLRRRVLRQELQIITLKTIFLNCGWSLASACGFA